MATFSQGIKGISRFRSEELIHQAHFICPRCRGPGRQSQLQLDAGSHREGGFVWEGFLRCPEPLCANRYPIVQGVPVILKDIPRWWRASRQYLMMPAVDTPELAEYFLDIDRADTLAGDQSRLLSTYMDAHYVQADSSFWSTVTDLCEKKENAGRALDLGCSVGRYTFELARRSEFAIGLDSNFFVLAAAVRIQREQRVRFERRLRGSVYETVDFPLAVPPNLLFIVADALDPPFLAESFDLVAGLNILDNVEVPLILLGQMNALLRSSGLLILSSPYEWRETFAEPVEWLENNDMDAATMVKGILENKVFPMMELDYRIIEEHAEVAWTLRQQQRYQNLYSTHILKAQKG